MPQTQVSTNYMDQSLILQVNILNSLIAFIVFFHIGLIFFGLFHAIWGQYFYFPFLVENAELHIGPRPKTSIYSGGQTSWQDEKEKNTQRFFPKFWYGWFGHQTKTNSNFLLSFQNTVINFFKKIRKQFRK